MDAGERSDGWLVYRGIESLEVTVEEELRGLAGEGAVAAFAVVEGFEVIEDGRGGGGFGGEGCAVMEDLGLEGGAGAFREGVVGAVTGGAHALAEVVAGEARAGGGGGVWAAAIGRAEGTWRDDAGIESAAQGIGDNLGVEGAG